MEKKKTVQIELIATTIDNTPHVNVLTSSAEQPRLTPTGKISHAKTRVYTQRYRKEWEQTPDFEGWLTSVPFQPTRAYCTYCKKNLHAHRLSLLKHTCTMKHQRAALMHRAEQKKKASLGKEGIDNKVGELEEAEARNNIQVGAEEDVEYVVERLDMDDDEMADAQREEENIECVEEEEEEEEEHEENNEEKPAAKKLKTDLGSQNDPLAQAMAHVKCEYLQEYDNEENLEMETETELENQNKVNNVKVVDVPHGQKEMSKESFKEAQENDKRRDSKSEKRSGTKSTDEPKKSDTEVVAVTLPILGTAYQLNTQTVVPTCSTIGVLQPINALPIGPGQAKTITLTTGDKTVTLTGGTFQPGGQYVLSKLKGAKFPTLIMTEKKAVIDNSQIVDASKATNSTKLQEQTVVAGTSRQTMNKHVVLKPVRAMSKKQRISTHVVDTSKGTPIGGLQVSLYKLMDGRWTFLNESTTNANGRCADLVDNMKANFTAGRYKIHFDVDKYFTLRKIETMYPFIEIVFDVKNPAGYYHIPLLLSPFGYTTYRGSER